jgi:hypothetical protein
MLRRGLPHPLLLQGSLPTIGPVLPLPGEIRGSPYFNILR